ncbi:Exodeoxyribonuclease 7 small subunit [Beijerinckiaceae bacterium RH AL1]|jgi:exodeoxyribonuclease VII small subunit|nr:exodeoxyribonuclease VII small subunit [Beijerinckiaceae bacterium]VVB46445.1 Exodeoxyribonuclease 7 small subunit [Beijerinckiaceae bacterium RH CH11]VVB46530.1 Exodeoxyribonuclease 7 small subunit [Beijerinckiaceae bacterium RH AL8]VVC55378.1 Exodeoxyribonuclease 7 small subunit [Beijerinckiaceae bacterium RH AL1]
MNEPDPNAAIAALPFEAAMKELEAIVDKLERGQVALEESIAIYERGEALKAHCDRLLKSAEARIEKITLSRDGKPTGTAPLDPE